MDSEKIAAFAEQLFLAEARREAITPPVAQDSSLSPDDAYRIQLANVRRALGMGHVISGKKVGLTSREIQKQFGVHEPDYGHLFAAMECADGRINTSELVRPKIEGEIAFFLKGGLSGGKVTRDDVLANTEYVSAAFEIVDSRVADWKITLADTVADNASSGRYVLGAKKLKPGEVSLPDVTMTLRKNGEVIALGTGATVMGDPCLSVAWLANRLWDFGVTLEAGEVILSGSFSAALLASKGDRFSAEFSSFGIIEAEFV